MSGSCSSVSRSLALDFRIFYSWIFEFLGLWFLIFGLRFLDLWFWIFVRLLLIFGFLDLVLLGSWLVVFGFWIVGLRLVSLSSWFAILELPSHVGIAQRSHCRAATAPWRAVY